MSENVRCADCGWLAVRLKLTRDLVDADHGFRQNAYVAETGVGTGSQFIYHRTPVCFANKRNFYDELRAPDADGPRVVKAISEVLPICDDFTEWKPGTTPKELQTVKMLEEQRKWQESETAKREDAETRRHWQSIVITAIVSLVSAGIGAAAAFWATSGQ